MVEVAARAKSCGEEGSSFRKLAKFLFRICEVFLIGYRYTSRDVGRGGNRRE
jgi:hypothetical protein